MEFSSYPAETRCCHRQPFYVEAEIEISEIFGRGLWNFQARGKLLKGHELLRLHFFECRLT